MTQNYHAVSRKRLGPTVIFTKARTTYWNTMDCHWLINTIAL